MYPHVFALLRAEGGTQLDAYEYPGKRMKRVESALSNLVLASGGHPQR